MRPLLLLVCLILAYGCASGKRDAKGWRRDSAVRPLGARSVRVTYLGTNGYLLESRAGALLIDPYFSRVPLARAALNLRVKSEPALVRWGLGRARAPRHVNALLVTHGHFDHLLDTPEVLRLTGARLLASRTSVALAGSGRPVEWGESIRAGAARITVLPAAHDRVLGRIPFPGEHICGKPANAGDWVCGKPLAFLIEMGGQRIYLDSGGTPEGPLPQVGKVDLAIAGVALPDSRRRLPRLLAALQPRYFLPSHQDDFFRPLAKGFTFGPLTDFPTVEHLARAGGRELILLDYFQPWTLR